ncbi:MAG: hypothetical protein BRC41_19270 [Cyanobacteria bacterium QH_9_48_43]|nr:MAG: hypothetical protein BRC41_19270 [Cyanobacteria bacterium QH_9_48_43]
MNFKTKLTAAIVTLASVGFPISAEAGEYGYLAKSEEVFEERNLNYVSDKIDVGTMLEFGYTYCEGFDRLSPRQVFTSIETLEQENHERYPNRGRMVRGLANSQRVMALAASKELCPQYEEDVNRFIESIGNNTETQTSLNETQI